MGTHPGQLLMDGFVNTIYLATNSFVVLRLACCPLFTATKSTSDGDLLVKGACVKKLIICIHGLLVSPFSVATNSL